MATPQELMALAAAKKAEQSTEATTSPEATKIAAPGRKFQLPSAPCNFVFADGKAKSFPEGIVDTALLSEAQAAEIEAAYDAGNVWLVGDPITSDFTKVPNPTDRAVV